MLPRRRGHAGDQQYDEFGKPQAGNSGRFQYTGQMWLPELGLYYYKARFYAPHIGRFVQTDPIGYGAGANFYNGMGGDPVNGTDPTGTFTRSPENPFDAGGILMDPDNRPPSLFGQHSYDWGGQVGMNDEMAYGELLALSDATGITVSCLLTCSYGTINAKLEEAGFGGLPSATFKYVPGSVSGPNDPKITITAGKWVWTGSSSFGANGFRLAQNTVQPDVRSLMKGPTGVRLARRARGMEAIIEAGKWLYRHIPWASSDPVKPEDYLKPDEIKRRYQPIPGIPYWVIGPSPDPR